MGTPFGGIFYDNCLRNGVPAILQGNAGPRLERCHVTLGQREAIEEFERDYYGRYPWLA